MKSLGRCDDAVVAGTVGAHASLDRLRASRRKRTEGEKKRLTNQGRLTRVTDLAERRSAKARSPKQACDAREGQGGLAESVQARRASRDAGRGVAARSLKTGWYAYEVTWASEAPVSAPRRKSGSIERSSLTRHTLR